MRLMGKILKELRLEKDLSQSELAARFKVSQNTIHRWEKSIQEPDIERLIEIAGFFDVSLDYLCGRTTDIFYQAPYQLKPNHSPTEVELNQLFKELNPYEQGQVIGFTKALKENTDKAKKPSV